mgnify:CR=1 FL=1
MDPELQKKVQNKMFKSNITLDKLIDFAEEKQNLLGGEEFDREKIKDLVDENSYDMRITFFLMFSS